MITLKNQNFSQKQEQEQKQEQKQKQEQEWIDFSTLSSFMKCPRKYYWQTRKNIRVSSSAMTFGKAIHDALASYFVDKNIEKALSAFKSIALGITEEDPKRNLTTGEDILLHYFEIWKNESYTTLMTDVPFAIELGKEKPFLYVGKIDRVVESPIGIGIMEHKTSSVAGERWLNRVNPNLQMEGYIAALQTLINKPCFGGVLDIIHIHEKRAQRKLQRVIKTQYDSENWARNVVVWMNRVRKDNEMNFHPQNTEACAPLFGMTCEYLEMCNVYPYPYSFEEFGVPEKYEIREWHPFEELKVREMPIPQQRKEK